MSIVGVLMAAGMMGGLALFLSDLMKNQHIEQKKSETGVAMISLHQRVLSIFNDGKALYRNIEGHEHNGYSAVVGNPGHHGTEKQVGHGGGQCGKSE